MLYLVKWQGFLLLGWLIARWIRGEVPARRWLGWLALAGSSGGSHAPVACLCLLADPARVWSQRYGPALPALIPCAVTVMTTGLLVALGSFDGSVLVALAALVVLLLLRARSGIWRHALPGLLVSLVVLGAGFGRSSVPFAATGLAPVLSLADLRGDGVDAARWVRENVDADAVFVAPPDLGEFRLLARRALVVDWKAVPFEELAMREWRERIRFCYGETASSGFAARDEMERGYLNVTDARLAAIRDRYGARFALLHLETSTTHPVLYANATYRVVAL